MYALICILLPSLISIKLEQRLLKENKNKLDLFINYGIYCLLNNLLTLIIMIFIFNVRYYFEEAITIYPAITVKYMIIGIVVSILLSFIKIIIAKNIGVEIEVKNKISN